MSFFSTAVAKANSVENEDSCGIMAAMRRWVYVAVLLGGCHFGLKGVDGTNGGSSDDGGIAAGADLALSISPADLGTFEPSHVPPGTLNSDASDAATAMCF